MSNSEKPSILSDVLDLSKKSFLDNFSPDVKIIIKDYNNDVLIINDIQELEKIEAKINNELQVEESISTLLLAMKSSQTKSFLNPVKPTINSRPQLDLVHDSKSKQKPEVAPEGSKSDEFFLTLEMSRKLLDHQFITRQKMINSQLEKTLYEIPIKRQQVQYTNEFIPNTSNPEFIALVGFSQVIDVLKQEQQNENPESTDESSFVDTIDVCHNCQSEASSVWKKRKISNDIEETICSTCNNEINQSQNQKDLEEQIKKIKMQFDEQEKNLIRDYNDMLSSPKKLEMFRQEQEKRHRMQRLNINSNKTARPATVNSSQIIVSNANKPNIPLSNKSNNNHNNSNICPSSSVPNSSNKILHQLKDSSNNKSLLVNTPSNVLSNIDPSQSQITYLQFLQAFATQATNSQQTIDQENLKKLEQILSAIQSNPILANNNMSVLQLIANLSNQQDTNNNNNSISPNANPAAVNASHTHLMNLLSYFVNLMQTQQNQNNTL